MCVILFGKFNPTYCTSGDTNLGSNILLVQYKRAKSLSNSMHKHCISKAEAIPQFTFSSMFYCHEFMNCETLVKCTLLTIKFLL